MKLLMFYAFESRFRTHEKAVPEAPDLQDLEEAYNGAVVVFYHAEAEDMGREEKIIVKFVKNVKFESVWSVLPFLCSRHLLAIKTNGRFMFPESPLPRSLKIYERKRYGTLFNRTE